MADFLRKNINVFAWQSLDIPGIEAEVMCHKLHIIKSFKPVKQKSRRTSPEKAKVVEEEVQKLLKAGTIRETQFPEWVFNLVVVRNKSGK